MRTTLSTLLLALVASGCGSLENKAMHINVGDSKDKVASIMGTPDDRQVKDKNEAWQYCQTGAGFGWHDYRVIWFRDGKVTGLNSYKSTRPRVFLYGRHQARSVGRRSGHGCRNPESLVRASANGAA